MRIIVGHGFHRHDRSTHFWGPSSVDSVEHRIGKLEERAKEESEGQESRLPIEAYQGLDREQKFMSDPPYHYNKDHTGHFADELAKAIAAQKALRDSIPIIHLNYPNAESVDDLRCIQVARQIYMDIVEDAISAAVSFGHLENTAVDILLSQLTADD